MKRFLYSVLNAATRRLLDSMEPKEEARVEVQPEDDIPFDFPSLLTFKVRVSEDEVVQFKTTDVFSDFARLHLQFLSDTGAIPRKDYLTEGFEFEMRAEFEEPL